MRDTQAYIERIRRVSRDYQRLELAVDTSLSAMLAGQALLARRIEKDYEVQHWNPYLRELWFPVEILNSNTIVVEVPAATSYQPGQLLSLLGPIGRPFKFRRKLRNVLLIVYDTPPTSLLMMLPALLANDASVTMVLMGTAGRYETGHLPEEIEIVHADEDLSWQDMVMTLGWADQVFVLVGPSNELNNFADVMRLVRERRNDVPRITFLAYSSGSCLARLGLAMRACCVRMTGPSCSALTAPPST